MNHSIIPRTRNSVLSTLSYSGQLPRSVGIKSAITDQPPIGRRHSDVSGHQRGSSQICTSLYLQNQQNLHRWPDGRDVAVNQRRSAPLTWPAVGTNLKREAFLSTAAKSFPVIVWGQKMRRTLQLWPCCRDLAWRRRRGRGRSPAKNSRHYVADRSPTGVHTFSAISITSLLTAPARDTQQLLLLVDT